MFTGKVSLGVESLYDKFGIIAVDIDTGMQETHFGVTQKIVEEKSPNTIKPFFYGVEREPFTFGMKFTKQSRWTYDEKIEFARMLFQPFYQDLRSEEYPEVVYKVICVDEPKKIFNGEDRGYITVQFRTDSAYAWSPLTIETFNVTGASEESPYVLHVENKSNVVQWYKPEIEIQTVGNTSFKMINLTDAGSEFIFTDIFDGETIYINNETKKVLSDEAYPNNYRLDKFNKNWLRLAYGVNVLHITTDCIISFRMQYPMAV